eukprot:3542437-Amphidinium_carterae.1
MGYVCKMRGQTEPAWSKFTPWQSQPLISTVRVSVRSSRMISGIINANPLIGKCIMKVVSCQSAFTVPKWSQISKDFHESDQRERVKIQSVF